MLGTLLGRKIESRANANGPGREERGFNLANLRDPALIRLFGGGHTSTAGVEVTEETALSVGAVKQAVKLLSETMGMLPLHIYERSGDRERQKKRAPQHPLYKILHTQPNPEMTRMEWISFGVANLVLRGNFYSEIVRDNGGRVRELWPIPASAMKVKRDIQTRAIKYSVTVAGQEKPLRADQVLHIRNFQTSGLCGRGLLDDACEPIGTMMAAEQSAAGLYKNGLQVGGTLAHPKTLGEDGMANLRKSIDDQVGGIGKAGRYLLLEEGMTYTAGGNVTPKDAELIPSRKFGVLEVARHTNLPPHLLMDLDRATFSNIEEQGIQFVTYSLGPFIARIEQRIGIQLFSEAEQDRFFAEFNVDGLLRGNIKARYEAYQIAVQIGLLSRNECRDFEGMAPYDGGDVILEPLNMAAVGSQGGNPGPAPAKPSGNAPPQDGEEQTRGARRSKVELRGTAKSGLNERRRLQESYQKVIATAAGTLVRREAREIKKLADKYLPAARGKNDGREERSANTFLDKAEAYYGGDYKQQIRELLGPALEAYAQAVAGSVADQQGGETPPFSKWLEAYASNMADARAKTKYGQLIELIRDSAADQARSDLDTYVDDYVVNEPDEVGTRESVQMGNGLARVAFGAFGIQKFTWVMSANACPICQEQDGQEAKTDPPLHKGCACSITPATD